MQIARVSKASWFKLKIENIIIHFDPGYTGYFENQGIPMYELNEKADYIFISHFHKDHLQTKAIDLIAKDVTKIFAPDSCAKRINRKISIVKPGEQIEFEFLNISTVDAYNTPDGNSTRKVHHKGQFVGYIIEINKTRIYHAGDTDFIPEMKTFKNIDIAFLPIGGTFVMDIIEAIKAVQTIKPKIVIPMHQSKNNLNDFKTEIERLKLKTKAIILNPGNIFEYCFL